MNASSVSPSLETVVSLCKRRGFVFPAADIYGGINGVYDFGPLGVALRKNIQAAWLSSLKNIYGPVLEFQGSLLGPSALWKASGHLDGFHDPMVDCKNCKRRFRADELDLEKACAVCGKKDWTEIRSFNMMFKTQLGALEDASSVSYLRPETAQAIFVNFKNILSTNRVKLPFGVAQIGKAFRNEITPKQFLFRMREFEQMELEFFCKPEDADKLFEFWVDYRFAFYNSLGISQDKLRIHQHQKEELAHYSSACSDIEYQFPFGWKELEGVAHRGTFDLSAHTTASGKDLMVFDEETKQSYTPVVIESSVGLDRLFLTILCDAYKEDVIDGESRVFLALHPRLSPIKVACMPLVKKLSDHMHPLCVELEAAGIVTEWDESGSIGKRYRRQDEIGTPFCITYDFESDQDRCVTIRDRDTTKQERIPLERVVAYIQEKLKL